jgi:hypothetical protein
VFVARPSFDEILGGRVSYAGRDIHATFDEPVLAVDVHGEWGAIFKFSVSDSGEWFASTNVVRRLDGRWEDSVSGGSHGGDWTTPWRPPARGWGGSHLLVIGTTKQTVFDAEEQERELAAVSGFASGAVGSIRLQWDGGERRIAVSPVGAFVALAVGTGAMTLAALTADGRIVGEPTRVG